MKRILSWLACLFLVLALTSGSKVTTICVIGDSAGGEKQVGGADEGSAAIKK